MMKKKTTTNDNNSVVAAIVRGKERLNVGRGFYCWTTFLVFPNRALKERV